MTIVDRNNYHLFQPLLYQVASTGLNPSEISAVVRSNFRGRANVRVLKAEMTGLDKESKRVILDNGSRCLGYDYLILGIGGKTCYFGNEQWAEKAPGLKSLEDAVTIRNRLLDSFEQAELQGEEACLEELTSVVVIGGGPTGVELAGAFAELRSKVLGRDFSEFDPQEVKVTLVEGSPNLLNGYDRESSRYAKARLEKMGVEVFLKERVVDVREDGVQTGERFLKSRNVIWAAGVEGNPIARVVSDKVDGRGRLQVTPDLRVEGEDDIYACGDMAHYGHDQRFPRGLPGVAPVAIQQGHRAAKNILARIDGKDVKPFHYFDKGKLATIGRSAAVAEADGFKIRGFSAWVAWLFVHLLYLAEFQDRVLVCLRWVWSYLTWYWGVRLIFSAGDCPEAEEENRRPATPQALPRSSVSQEPCSPAADS